MEDRIIERVISMARTILEKRETIRNIAVEFDVSKSTAHKDLTERLIEVDESLYRDVKELLDYNKSVRHIRGGHSTKLKYLNEHHEEELKNLVYE
ncbi:sporulation transcriptional regulator SpoIIID [Haloplasma contractile]|uniref:Stage III sporulation protein D n=1 Tax=Haloplasma contractile SSD-17B TaxID=1033810 RepID=U2E8C7_9MOLU|nr:sporulation transcriptional regulator SpoIIID [Haloplasma contractile]ERJ11433.1 Stage III sporulation protein D [Haloplasma contractile SSD-17B]